jgi:hypothetical protein
MPNLRRVREIPEGAPATHAHTPRAVDAPPAPPALEDAPPASQPREAQRSDKFSWYKTWWARRRGAAADVGPASPHACPIGCCLGAPPRGQARRRRPSSRAREWSCQPPPRPAATRPRPFPAPPQVPARDGRVAPAGPPQRGPGAGAQPRRLARPRRGLERARGMRAPGRMGGGGAKPCRACGGRSGCTGFRGPVRGRAEPCARGTAGRVPAPPGAAERGAHPRRRHPHVQARHCVRRARACMCVCVRVCMYVSVCAAWMLACVCAWYVCACVVAAVLLPLTHGIVDPSRDSLLC